MIIPHLFLIYLLLYSTVCKCDQSSSEDEDSWATTLWHALMSDELDHALEGDVELPHSTSKGTPLSDDEDCQPPDDVITDQSDERNETEDIASPNDTNITQTRIKYECVPYEGCTPQLNCTNMSNINDTNLEGVANMGQVVGINVTQLLYLLENMTHTNSCILIMFYATSCQYSIDFGRVYNKLGVVFPQLPVVAMDYGEHSPERYLLAYVPRVILYYSGRVVYDIDTNMKIENLTEIIANMTGVSPDPIPSDDVMDEKYSLSPIPRDVIEDNTMLWLSTVSVVGIIIGNCILKSELFMKYKEWLFPGRRD